MPMNLIRFYFNKLTGRESVLDFSILGETLRLNIATQNQITRAKKVRAETEWVDLMRNTVTIGDTIFDVGANNGVFSLLLAKHDNGLDSTLVCFEPDPERFSQLTQTIKHNQLLGRLQAHQVALWADNGTADMLIPSREHKGETNTIGIKLQTMASFAEEHGVSPDIVKINVGSAAGQVLAGMESLISEQVPTHIFINIHSNGEGECMPDGTTAIDSWLTQRGYNGAWKNKRGKNERCHFTLKNDTAP